MLLPLSLRIANSVLDASRCTHDMAITTLTTSTNVLFTNDVPKPLREYAIAMLSDIIIYGDMVGSFILQLYIQLIDCLS